MAVAPMRRVEVVGYAPVLDDVLDALQRAGAVQVEPAPEGLPTCEIQQSSERHRRIEELSADAKFVKDLLARHHTPTQPFAAFISEKFHLGLDEFATLDVAGELLPLYELCNVLADRIAAGKREKARLAALVTELEPWKSVRLEISRWKGTEHVALIAGVVPSSDAPSIRERLREAAPLVSVAEYGTSGVTQAWIVLAHVSALADVRSTLASTKFREVSFPGLENYPAEEAARASVAIGLTEQQIAEAESELELVARDHYEQAVALLEAMDSARGAAETLCRFGRTERAFVLSGWVRASRGDALIEMLRPWESELDITLREPADDEDPPVELDNPRFLRAFETLTDLYGRPGYRELDPTPLLAPFFLLFFAICISDVGYGAMLILGSWLIKTKLDVAPGVKRFLDLMMIGGAGAMAVGVAFASYFAIPVESLPPFLRAMQLLDPLAQLQTFLLIAIGLGVVQVFFGVGIAAYDSFRAGDPGSAIAEQLSTIFLFVMIAVCVVAFGAGNSLLGAWALVIGLVGTMLLQGRALEAALGDASVPLWDRAVGWAWLAAVAVSMYFMATTSVGLGLAVLAGACAVALATKTGRKSVVALLGGVYAVYGMSSFLGDILSYTRLAALGLSGALVGMVFNILAGLVWGPVSGLWAAGGLGWLGAAVVAVLAGAVFVFGHIFNVVINLLGAFVHPARLQFVEFFSKFYSGGGRPLKPFRFVTRSVVLDAGSARQEGAR